MTARARLRRAVFLLVGLILGLALGLGQQTLRPPTYRSSATLSLVVSDTAATTATAEVTTERALAYADVAVTPQVAADVQRSAGIADTAEGLLGSMRVVVPAGSSDLELSAYRSSAQEAQALDEAWTKVLEDRIRQTEKERAPAGSPTLVVVRQLAPSVGAAQAGNEGFYLLMAALLGGVLALSAERLWPGSAPSGPFGAAASSGAPPSARGRSGRRSERVTQ